MDANPPLGVLLHTIGGLASAVFYLPYRKVRHWAWESFWLAGGIFSWIVAPWIFAAIAIPDLLTVLRESPTRSLVWSYVCGALWGIGGLSFGLTVRFLGLALGTAMALGYCAAFGTLFLPILRGQFGEIARERSGQIVLAGVGVCLIGIVISGLAGISKEREQPDAEKKASIKEFSFVKGFWVATFCGILSACMSYGIDMGKPIAAIALQHGASPLWQNLAVLVVVLAGGFTTNFIWCMILNARNRSGGDYFSALKKGSDPSNPAAQERVPIMANYLLCAAAGTMWYLQFFFYSMGASKMGRFGFSSWSLHMASIIIFGTLVGAYLAEWKGASRRTLRLVLLGLTLLVGSLVVIGYGNYVETKQPKPVARLE
jgi:L-rhamnose-H+ transport protein